MKQLVSAEATQLFNLYMRMRSLYTAIVTKHLIVEHTKYYVGTDRTICAVSKMYDTRPAVLTC